MSKTMKKTKEKSTKLTQIYTEFDNVFNGIGCFEGTFSLQLKQLDRLQQLDIITPLGFDKTAEC